MPKSYSKPERQAIRADLLAQAGVCLAAYGIKKTTVDEIVRRAKIPKGTFYLFYESKEQLLFEVILQCHDQVQQEFLDSIRARAGRVTVDNLTEALFRAYQSADRTGLISIWAGGELDALIRKLPPNMTAEHLRHDNDMVSSLIELVPSAGGKNTAVYAAALQQLFLTTRYKHEIGENFDEALRLLLRGVAMQLMGEKHD